MRIDEYGEDSSVENRDDNEVSRWEDLQRILKRDQLYQKHIGFMKKNGNL